MLAIVQTLCEALWDLWERILKGSYRKNSQKADGSKKKNAKSDANEKSLLLEG